MKKILAILSAAVILCGCSESPDKTYTKKDISEVRSEVQSHVFSEYPNVSFKTKAEPINADDIYILTMKKVKKEKADEAEMEKMKDLMIKFFDIPESERDSVTYKVRNGGDGFVSYKENYGIVYHNSSTFTVADIEKLKVIPNMNINFEKYDLYNYRRGDYPKEELGMADGSKLSIDKAASQAEKCIRLLSESGMFDEGETQVLTRVAVNHTDKGEVLTLHYNQLRYGLEVDDGGCLTMEEDQDMMRDPYFEILFVGDDKICMIFNTQSGSVMEKQKQDKLIGIAEAEKILSDSLAEEMKAEVKETALRYCCIQQVDTVNHVFRPMWCFLLNEYKDGSTGMTPFPRITVYVDAISGDVYYCDSQKFIFEKCK